MQLSLSTSCFIVILFSSSFVVCHQDVSLPTLQYVITFISYNLISDHEVTVRTALALTPPTSWRLIARNNVAASLPTDFIVFETADTSTVTILRAHPTIRHVAPQTEHIRHLSAIRVPSDFEERGSSNIESTRHLTLHPFGSDSLRQRGFTGKDVSVAVFDTGLIQDHKYFPNLASQTDWTGENTTSDHVGHGTFVAGIIAGHHPSCPGLAPDVRLHVFRVFTAAQVSYTSWFLDAFNYALHIGIDVLNLSIGGPDFADNPFTEKIDELAAHGIIAVSAIGNDGPLWGSLNNPGDMMPVVGVGGAEPDGRVASFSSRGMTTHELDHFHQSYGRVKPDTVAYARSLAGPSHRAAERCKRLSGTSVASPVVAGAIALLASTVPLSRRRSVVTPASVKRALISSAHRLSRASMYEQGAGLLDIKDACEEMARIDREFVQYEGARSGTLKLSNRVLQPWDHHRATKAEEKNKPFAEDNDHENNKAPDRPKTHPPSSRRRLASLFSLSTTPGTFPGPNAAFFPSYYDLRTADCSYMWPHCAQPIFEGGMSVHLNVTILNPGGIIGRVERVTWEPGRNGEYLRVLVTPPDRFWPWSAGMGIHLSAVGIPSEKLDVEGVLSVRVLSVHEMTYSDIELPIKANVVPPPPKEKRLLWDLYHSIRYPPGYVPRDNLAETKDMLDWLGDHPHTNFHALFRELVSEGFSIDILDQPFSCLGNKGISQYGGILILDSEDFFSLNDTNIIEESVKFHGVSLIVAAEWYNLDVMQAIRFEDDNTRSWWSPVIAGGNIPALNDLLSRFEVGFGEEVVSGNVKSGSYAFLFDSGVPLVRFPPGGELLYASGLRRYETGTKSTKSMYAPGEAMELPIFGITKAGAGAVLVYGDTNCLDTAYSGSKCYSFFVKAIQQTINKCAGTGTCKQMFQQSVISIHGLQPSRTLDSLDREAKPLPESILNVFKPHSKYELQWICSAGRRCVMKTILDEEKACAVRTALQMAPIIDTSRDLDAVSLPLQRQATPVGSENNYYSDSGSSWWSDRLNADSNSSEIRNVSDLFGINLSGSPIRSLSLILLGLCLMFASISLRRMGQRGAHGRRHAKEKAWKPRFVNTTATRRVVGASGRDLMAGQRNSSLRVTCSSSSSIAH